MIQEAYFMKYFTPLTGVFSCLLLCEVLSMKKILSMQYFRKEVIIFVNL